MWTLLLLVVGVFSYEHDVSIDSSLRNVTWTYSIDTSGAENTITETVSYPIWDEEPNYHARIFGGISTSQILDPVEGSLDYTKYGSCDPIKAADYLDETPGTTEWETDIEAFLALAEVDSTAADAARNGWTYTTTGDRKQLSHTLTVSEFIACTSGNGEPAFNSYTDGENTKYVFGRLFTFVNNASAIATADGSIDLVNMYAWKKDYVTVHVTQEGNVSAIIQSDIADVDAALIGAIYNEEDEDLYLTYKYTVHIGNSISVCTLNDFEMDIDGTSFVTYATNGAGSEIISHVFTDSTDPDEYTCINDGNANVCVQYIVYKLENVLPAVVTAFESGVVTQTSTGFTQGSEEGFFTYKYSGEGPAIEFKEITSTYALEMDIYTDELMTSVWDHSRQVGSYAYAFVSTPQAESIVGTPNELILEVTKLTACMYTDGTTYAEPPVGAVNCEGASLSKVLTLVAGLPTGGANEYSEYANPIGAPNEHITSAKSLIAMNTFIHTNAALHPSGNDGIYIMLMATVNITNPASGLSGVQEVSTLVLQSTPPEGTSSVVYLTCENIGPCVGTTDSFCCCDEDCEDGCDYDLFDENENSILFIIIFVIVLIAIVSCFACGSQCVSMPFGYGYPHQPNNGKEGIYIPIRQ